MILPRLALLAAPTLLAMACAPAMQTGAPGPPGEPRTPPASTRQLIERMQMRYDGRWYETVAFRQANVTYTSLGEQRSEWIQQQRVPQRVRIDFVAPSANGSGLLYRNDSTYVFDATRIQNRADQSNPLPFLSADVYALPVERVMAKLVEFRIDTTRFRRDRWRDADVWIVGGEAGDTTSNQLWVEADRLLLVRLLYAAPTPTGRLVAPTDMQLTYQTVDGFQLPREIVYYRNGRAYSRQAFLDVRPNAPLEEQLFDPARWAQFIPSR